jgi:hypothetical protein
MPRKGLKQPYKARKEYGYTIKDIADLGGMTRNALNVAKAHGKIDPADFRSVVSYLTRRIIDRRLTGDLFVAPGQTPERTKGGTQKNRSPRKTTRKTGGHK